MTGISGDVNDDGLISSLTFHTNKRKHEAFHLTLGIGKTGPPTKMEFHFSVSYDVLCVEVIKKS